jgi:hypothetical protein
MNHFGNWKNDDKGNQVLNLYQRSIELQQLLQLFQPAALLNIIQHHPAQIKSTRKSTYHCFQSFNRENNTVCQN